MPAATSHQVDEFDPLTHLPLVGHVVHQLAARYPRSVDRSAMWNAGAAGLLHAASRADATGMLFSQHAIRVIRAAILDTIDVTVPHAMPISDQALADGFDIAADQIAVLRDTQIRPAVTPTIPPLAPASAAPREVPAPLTTTRPAARWTPAAVAAYR